MTLLCRENSLRQAWRGRGVRARQVRPVAGGAASTRLPCAAHEPCASAGGPLRDGSAPVPWPARPALLAIPPGCAVFPSSTFSWCAGIIDYLAGERIFYLSCCLSFEVRQKTEVLLLTFCLLRFHYTSCFRNYGTFRAPPVAIGEQEARLWEAAAFSLEITLPSGCCLLLRASARAPC